MRLSLLGSLIGIFLSSAAVAYPGQSQYISYAHCVDSVTGSYLTFDIKYDKQTRRMTGVSFQVDGRKNFEHKKYILPDINMGFQVDTSSDKRPLTAVCKGNTQYCQSVRYQVSPEGVYQVSQQIIIPDDYFDGLKQPIDRDNLTFYNGWESKRYIHFDMRSKSGRYDFTILTDRASNTQKRLVGYFNKCRLSDRR